MSAILYTRVDTCVPGKGSFRRGTKKARVPRSAVPPREPAFIGDTGSPGLSRRRRAAARGAFFREIGFAQRRFLPFARPLRCPLFEGERKRSLKMRPGLRRGRCDWGSEQEGSSKRGDLMTLPIALADNLRLVYRRRRNQSCKWLNRRGARNHSRNLLLSRSTFDDAAVADY